MIELTAGDLQLLSRHRGRAMNAATQHSMAPPEGLRDSIAVSAWEAIPRSRNRGGCWDCFLHFALVPWVARAPPANTVIGLLLLGATPQAQNVR
jgi:hypothetical protein